MKQQSPDLAVSNLLWFIYQWNCDHNGHPSNIEPTDFRSAFSGYSDEEIKTKLRILIEDAKWIVRCGMTNANNASVIENYLWGVFNLTEDGLTEVLWLENYVRKSV